METENRESRDEKPLLAAYFPAMTTDTPTTPVMLNRHCHAAVHWNAHIFEFARHSSLTLEQFKCLLKASLFA